MEILNSFGICAVHMYMFGIYVHADVSSVMSLLTKVILRFKMTLSAQISTLCRRRKSDQGFMMPRPRDGFLQIYQESNVRGGAHCGGWFTPHYRFLPPCARGGSGVFLQ